MLLLKYYAAADIGGTNIKYGIVDGSGNVTYNSKTATQAQKGGEHLVRSVTRIIDTLVHGEYPVSGIGISSAGVVDDITGRILYANGNIPDYAGTKWKDTLSQRFGLPVYVCNDVMAAGEAEAWVGAGKSCGSFLCVVIGTGIGGSVFINGKRMDGAHNRAASLGYMNTAGDNGMFEKKASTIALVNKLIQLTGDGEVNGKNAFERAGSGNPVYVAALDGWFGELAKGIANAVICFDPERVIIGGAVSHEGEPFLRRVEKELKKYMPEFFLSGISFQTAKCGNLAGMIGAVRHLAEQK